MLPEDLEAKIVRLPECGCWIWIAYLGKRDYGEINKKQAHRVVYELINGPIPLGLELDHLCRIHCCVNPCHLEPVTHKENVRRGKAGHHMKEKWADSKACKNGHPWTHESTYIRPDTGRRSCKICISNRTAVWQTKRNENVESQWCGAS